MCTTTLDFPPRSKQQRRRERTTRTLGDKLQELGSRSPDDVYALETVVDSILERLDGEAGHAQQNG